jgi:hypothetical protein
MEALSQQHWQDVKRNQMILLYCKFVGELVDAQYWWRADVGRLNELVDTSKESTFARVRV